MTTLVDYAGAEFPRHRIERYRDDRSNVDLTLTDHTVVAHAVGLSRASDLLAAVRNRIPGVRAGAVVVRPTEASVVPHTAEDKEGIFDLPRRRVVTATIVGAVVAAVAAGLIAAEVSGNAGVGVGFALFFALIGGGLAFLLGGGGRYAGDRAWTQPQAPQQNIVVVGAFVDDEGVATDVAQVMERLTPETVRVIGSRGDWHVPNT